MTDLRMLFDTFLETLRDAIPIFVVIFGSQLFLIRQPIKHPRRVIIGWLYVLLGMALFVFGLQEALFPIGKLMAEQLASNSAPTFADGVIGRYGWVYVFAAAIGFSTTIAEPALIAVASKAHDLSGGAISEWGLRIAVAIGVSVGITLGVFRIITGTPLHYFIIAGYVVVVLQTMFAPKLIIALAYDSGGVTTSTVTVPIVTALGLGLAATIPGRSPILDGFGLIAFASLVPMITVMGYAQIAEWRERRGKVPRAEKQSDG